MAQDLSQILAELNPVYDPQRASINQQQAALDPQQQADLSGLNATKQSAFSDITQQANRNGLFYSGLPIAEEQKYVGGSYLPAVANLQSKYSQQKFSLQDALAKVQSDQYNQALTRRQGQLDTEEKQREFDRQLAATQAANAAGAASPGLNFGNANPPKSAVLGASAFGATPRVPGDPSQGFGFQDNAGNQINALQYSQGHNIPFYTLLQQMANAGDAGAKAGLQFIGNDGNADPTKVTTQAQADLYHALTGRYVGITPQNIGQLPKGLQVSQSPTPPAPISGNGLVFR